MPEILNIELKIQKAHWTTMATQQEKRLNSLYKDGNLIFSSEKDKNGELFAATPGKRTEITFKYSGEVSANITIADWATVIQHITMN